MGDQFGIYYQLASALSHLLLWTRGSPPVYCDCKGERDTTALDSCNQLVRDLVSTCLDTPSTTHTTTTIEHRVQWGFDWLWFVLLAFCLGWFVGKDKCRVRRKDVALLPPSFASSGSESSSPRHRGGVAA